MPMPTPHVVRGHDRPNLTRLWERATARWSSRRALLVLACLASLVVDVFDAVPAQAATYYVSPEGRDGDAGTEARPWGTFERAWRGMRRGDTLILLDGVYREALSPNVPIDPSNPQPIFIRAKNEGRAIIDGEGVRIPVEITDFRSASYVVIDGLSARNGTYAVYQVRNHHVTIRRSSGYGASTDLNSAVFFLLSTDTLVEDCVASGTGRKMFVIFEGNRNTIRRSFAYWQEWKGRQFCGVFWPYGAGFQIYDGRDNTVENSVAYGNAMTQQFYIKTDNQQSTHAVGNRMLGNIGIYAGRKPDGTPITWPTTRPQPTTCDWVADPEWHDMRGNFIAYSGGPLHHNLWQDNVAYGSAGAGFAITGNEGQFSSNVLRRFTAFGNGVDNPDGTRDAGRWGGKNVDMTQEDLDRFQVVDDSRVDRVFVKWPNYPTGERVFTSLTGGGARVRHRYVDGVLMDGSNGRPAQSLWPWPMEERVQRELGLSVTGLVSGIVPDQVKTDACLYTVLPGTVSLPASGGTAVVVVSTTAGCRWTAASAPWATPTPGAGAGPGEIELTAGANVDPDERHGVLSVAGQTVTLTQAPATASCMYSVTPATVSAPPEGGTTSVAVSADSACRWTASSPESWVRIAAGTGSGPGAVSLTLEPNAGSASRTARAIVAGQPVAITQSAVGQATRTTVSRVQASPDGQVGQFSRLDISFRIDGSPAAKPQWPYDPSPPLGIPAGIGISVNAVFTDPDGNRFLQPAFYAQDYLDQVRDGRDWHLPTGTFGWHVRFTPNKAGTWKYRITATDRTGTVETEQYSVFVVPSTEKGFIKVSKADPRYFEFDDGSAFLGTGVQLGEHLEDPETKGEPVLRKLGESGITFARMWISSVFGSAWNTWIGGRNQYRGYLPVTGLVPVADSQSGETSLAMRLDYEPDGDTGWFDACRFEFWDDPESIKPGATYRIKVEYRAESLSGPRVPGRDQYGLVVKMGGWNADCHEPGGAPVVTGYGRETTGWQTIEGRWNSGASNFLPRMHVALENVRQGIVHVRSISVREDLGNGTLGPEMLVRPSMEHHTYVPDEKAHAFDKVLEAAERHGIYLKLVVMEKNDKIYQKMRDDGGWVMSGADNENGFYGTGRQVNRTRWLQQTWWRYLQARWGYSTHIHSWELTNEGDPNSSAHYELSDEFGKFMHCRAFGVDPGAGDSSRCTLQHPNAHLVTTSFWHGFPADEFWANTRYPNVDYADLHAYVSTSFAPRIDKEQMQWDEAFYHLWHSQALPFVGKPVVRGEAGLDTPDEQSESALGLERDTAGVWLHNFLWAGLDARALYELYWWNSHIWTDAFDHRDAYRAYRAFVDDLPLNKGRYVHWGGTVSNPALRVVGQKNLARSTMHLWIQNRLHTWKNVVDRRPIPAASGDITVSGFKPGGVYEVQWWDTYSGAVSTDSVLADLSGDMRIRVRALETDIAMKVRPMERHPSSEGSAQRTAPVQ